MFGWTDADTSPLISPTAACTLSDEPLPRPSLQEFSNLDAMQTIRDNPHLFKIVTPINVDRFESLLETHPNKPFVQSVCISFREGFWPWANMQKEEYPATWDFSECPRKPSVKLIFFEIRGMLRSMLVDIQKVLGLNFSLGCTVPLSMLFRSPDPQR